MTNAPSYTSKFHPPVQARMVCFSHLLFSYSLSCSLWRLGNPVTNVIQKDSYHSALRLFFRHHCFRDKLFSIQQQVPSLQMLISPRTCSTLYLPRFTFAMSYHCLLLCVIVSVRWCENPAHALPLKWSCCKDVHACLTDSWSAAFLEGSIFSTTKGPEMRT